jgi:protease-4
MFLKNTLDKLGVEMQVIKVGTFKSAVEPFVNTEMSDANRLQTSRFMSSLWDNMLNQVSDSRKINKDSLNAFADKMMLFQPSEMNQKYHLTDSLVYVDEVDSILHFYAGKFEMVKHNKMTLVPVDETYQKDKLAVIYAVGGIDDGGTEGIISEDLVETIEEITKDDKIKSVVLRVNSPGGSAYGSEQIWHALQVLKTKKPLIVSMGDYAASGGYYISCMADTIVAQPNTLTGSIGIFGLIPNIQGLNKKLGFSYDVVKTNQLSDAISVNRPFSNEERLLMQNFVNRGYDLFVKRCADGRNISNDSIRTIAEGRVWTGEDAFKIGLIDVIGGLNDAIQIAAKKAKITEYQVKAYPEKEDFATRIMKSLEDDVEAKFMEQPFGKEIKTLLNIQKMEKIHRVQARLPYFIQIQ